MTKEQFLNGQSFTLVGQVSSIHQTYKFDKNALIRQYRDNNKRLLFNDHILNIDKITSTRFYGYTYILNDKVSRVVKFEDMIPFIEEVKEEVKEEV